MYDLAIIGLGNMGMETLEIAVGKNLKVIAFEENKIDDCRLEKLEELVKTKAELLLNDDKIEILADDNIHQAKKIIIATGAAIPKIMATGCKDECRLNIYDDFTTDFDNLYVVDSRLNKDLSAEETKKLINKILAD